MNDRRKFSPASLKSIDKWVCQHCGKPQLAVKIKRCSKGDNKPLPNRNSEEKGEKPKCCKCTKRMKDIILALVVRALFAAHGLIGIWRAQTEWNLVGLWLLLIPVAVLVLEALFTVGIRGGEEYKWVSPCVFLYLCGVVPSIWFLELKNLEIREGYHYCNDLFWGNLSTPGCRASFQSMPYADVNLLIANSTQLKEACQLERNYLLTLEELRKNGSLATTPEPVTAAVSAPDSGATTAAAIDGIGGDVVNTIEGAKKALDNLLSGVNIFDRTTWVLVLHQLLLFILIIGRWLLPTGEGISRDELSQLLLVFIGVGADILEFVTETIKEIAVRCDKVVIICIMAFWSWSTLQFTLVLTAAQARKSRAVGIYEGEGSSSSRVNSPVVVVEGEEKEKGPIARFFTNTEVWGIMSTLILQDGPFLGMRLYIMVGKQVVHQMIVFFTCKNCLVVILQLYRLIIIATAAKEEEEEEDEVIANPNIETVKALVTAQSKFKLGLKKKPQGDAASTSGGSSNGKATSKVAPSVENGKDLPGAKKETEDA